MNNFDNIQWAQIPFGPFVMKIKLPNYIIDRLHEDGKKKLKSYHKKLAGHIKTQLVYERETMEWFYSETTSVWNCYRENNCKFHGEENYQVELEAHDLWVNFMRPGDFNPVHTHGGDISFVIFVDVPNELTKEAEEFEGTGIKPGCLSFEFTQQARPKWAITGQSTIPETGDMYIFPAMLQHWVAPYKSKVTRVSVSGNLEIMNKRKGHI